MEDRAERYRKIDAEVRAKAATMSEQSSRAAMLAAADIWDRRISRTINSCKSALGLPLRGNDQGSTWGPIWHKAKRAAGSACRCINFAVHLPKP